RSYVSGTGRNRTRWEKILWQERKPLAVETDGVRSYATIDCSVPYDAKETDSRNPDNEILWKAINRARIPGLYFSAIFVLPVFKTRGSDANLTTAAIEADDEKLLDGKRPEDAKIETGIAPDGGVIFHYGPARNVKFALLLSLFGALFLGSG